MIRSILFLSLLVLGSVSGEIAIAYGTKTVGEPERLRPSALFAFLAKALRNGWFWLGVPMLALSFFSLLLLLSWEPVSFVVPASASSYVVGTFAAKYILGERISRLRWLGVVLICVGVALVTTG